MAAIVAPEEAARSARVTVELWTSGAWVAKDWSCSSSEVGRLEAQNTDASFSCCQNHCHEAQTTKPGTLSQEVESSVFLALP